MSSLSSPVGDNPHAGTSPAVRFFGVALTYPGPPPVDALLPTDLRIDVGEYVAIMGPSGSGKSTLLNVIGLLDRPTAGRYEIDGIDAGNLPERDRTAVRGRRIGFVFQEFHLLPHRSSLENVTLAMLYRGTCRSARMAAAAEALDQVELSHRLLALPTTLSGGERQRVAIARALVSRPSLLLCDEPTGNLDSVTAQGVMELISRLHAGGLTVIVITHDPQVAARGQRIIAMNDGRVETRLTS